MAEKDRLRVSSREDSDDSRLDRIGMAVADYSEPAVAKKPSNTGARNIFAPKWDNLVKNEKRENHRVSHNSKSSYG